MWRLKIEERIWNNSNKNRQQQNISKSLSFQVGCRPTMSLLKSPLLMKNPAMRSDIQWQQHLRCDFCMQVNLQRGRPVCPDRMSFSLEGQEKHYVKLRLGENDTCFIIIKAGKIAARVSYLVFILILVFCRPIPSNVNLKKEKPVCISFTFEGHGDHYVKRVMQWCRGWWELDVFHHYQEGKITARHKGRGEKKSYRRREKRWQESVERVSPTRQQLQPTICHQLPSSLYNQFAIMGKHSSLFRVVNQFCFVVSLYE